MKSTIDSQLIAGILVGMMGVLALSRVTGVWHFVAAVMIGAGIVLTVNSLRLRAKSSDPS